MLRLYVKTWCPWCIAAAAELRRLGHAFEEIDVESDSAAYRRMIDLSGQRLTPTLDADGHILADFGPEELADFLKRHSITP